jgi:hypothetical protein
MDGLLGYITAWLDDGNHLVGLYIPHGDLHAVEEALLMAVKLQQQP